jgi:uroporphyrin-III C-methyltransferase
MEGPRWRAEAGVVYLVGAGPGDPGLLTLKARDLLATSDCVLHDHLLDPAVLSFAPPEAERLDVGKVGHGAQTSQDRIHELLRDRARTGRRVVRLKGGCPTLFGRVAEEADMLRRAGVRFEIVPGVTSALAVPAYAGIPLTARGYAASVAIVAGHSASPERPPLTGVSGADTLVVLMAMRSLPSLVRQLLAAGRSEQVPAAVVSEGTTPRQRVVVATLGTIAAAAAAHGIEPPGVLVVGEVVRQHARLAWFSEAVPDNLVVQKS